MNKKVLVIDNAASYPKSYQLLIREGHRVDVVHNSDVGLQQLDTQAYDMIIAQENPEAESWQLCKRIRHLSGMPLIVISPNASADTCVRAINAGADYFLRKPFGPLEFLARAQSLWQRTAPKRYATIGS
jgi:two-component system response regulator VanR